MTRTAAVFPVANQAAQVITLPPGSDMSLIAPNASMVISNCNGAEAVTVATVDSTARTINLTAPMGFPNRYGPEASISLYGSAQYAVRNTGRTNSAGQAIFSLFRDVDTELVEGVEDMQIIYGLMDDSGNDSVVTYVSANAGSTITRWDRVISAQIFLRVASVEPVLTEAQGALTYAGTTFTPAGTDRRMRQIFSTTVMLRNGFINRDGIENVL